MDCGVSSPTWGTNTNLRTVVLSAGTSGGSTTVESTASPLITSAASSTCVGSASTCVNCITQDSSALSSSSLSLDNTWNRHRLARLLRTRRKRSSSSASSKNTLGFFFFWEGEREGMSGTMSQLTRSRNKTSASRSKPTHGGAQRAPPHGTLAHPRPLLQRFAKRARTRQIP